MTSNFEASKNSRHEAANGIGMDCQERDYFELLSAYLDGEVTATERKQVQQWLDSDPQIQRLHTRLLRLRHGIQKMPLPRAEQSAQETTQQVFQRIARRRFRKAVVWGGGAIAALFVGAVSFLLPENQSPIPGIAQSPESEVPSDTLMIAIHEPTFPIPKAAVTSPPPAESVEPLKEKGETDKNKKELKREFN